MSTIKDRLTNIWNELGNAHLVAVSKFHSTERIQEAYDAGQRMFGESRVQELAQKVDKLPTDIEWHFIGTLQRNKVKYIAPYIHTVHSIDRGSLLTELERQCERQGRIAPPIRVFLQLHISGEETKHGFSHEELMSFLEKYPIHELKHTHIVGLMGMAEYTDDAAVIEQQFETLHSTLMELQKSYFRDDPLFCELSMGMSHDYPLALKHGATYVRIGTDIFGAREY